MNALGLDHPVVLAPMAGGPSTPSLAAAVSEAGALGLLASGYLGADELARQMADTRSRTTRPFGVNLFVPGGAPPDPAALAAYVERLGGESRRAGVALGAPRSDDDGWEAKLALLAEDPPAVVSFTFGCPEPAVLAAMRERGSSVWVTITSTDEARQAAAAGADALVVQGAEAGGHRATFVDSNDAPVIGLLALLQSVRRAVDLPLVATGGIATSGAVAAVLCAGAGAAQVGTAFMRCPEAGTWEEHRRALATSTPTALTRAFTGRLARGLRNRFIDAHGPSAPIAYPQVHHLTSPLRKAGRAAGDPEVVNLWAGQAHALAEELPAGEVVAKLTPA